MSKTTQILTAVATAALLAGCSAGRPDVFLIPENEATYDRGEALIAEGERMIDEGEEAIDDGRAMRKKADRLIEQGRELRKAGEAKAARGREAVRAATMLEEAERLRREGTELQTETLPR